jgi:pimeloyl-ACP methyl ester carboxylesterase
MPYASNERIRIHYRTEGAGPPLVLQHWSLATMECWYDYGYVAALKNDYRLVLLDARGHGASDKCNWPQKLDHVLRWK